MRTNVILTLDARTRKADGTYPIVLRIIHYRKSTQVPTGISVRPEDWDAEGRCILPTYKGTQALNRLNNMLAKKKAEAMDLLLRLEETKKLSTYSAKQLKALIERKSDRASFFAYATEVAAELHAANKIGNARIYATTINVLKAFAGDKDLGFSQINHSFLLKFELSHMKNGGSLNGLSVYLRTLRAIFNRAIKEGVVDEALYPFRRYTIKGTKTRKRALSAESLAKIEAYETVLGHPLHEAKNLFLFSYYCRGMPFSDMAELKVKNIIDGRIIYARKKTNQYISIKLVPIVEAILAAYLEGKGENDYIFPIIHRIGAVKQYKDIEWARKAYNKKLKKLAAACGIQENITSYVSRHSFASKAKQMGIPIASISDMLGHDNVKTTEIYLSGLPDDELDSIHERVIAK